MLPIGYDRTKNWQLLLLDQDDGSGNVFGTQPTNINITATASITIGDGYVIKTGGQLQVSSSPGPTSNGGIVTFNDCAFSNTNLAEVGIVWTCNYNRCSFQGSSIGPGFYGSCCLGHGIFNVSPDGLIFMTCGLIITGTDDEFHGKLYLDSNVYVTGVGMILNDDTYANIFVSGQLGVEARGIQFQNCTSDFGGLSFLVKNDVGSILGATEGNVCLIWGNGNYGPGITIGPGATGVVSKILPPSVTGVGGDFAFIDGSTSITVARAVLLGQYTEAGSPATRTTTWSNFVTAIGSGGSNFAAFDPEINAALIAA